MTIIRKIGLCVLRGGRLLVALKKGGSTWILPGGKPEPGESDLEALHREVLEESGRNAVGVDRFLVCRSPAADRPGDEVELVAYVGALDGEPVASEEIAEFAWLDIADPQLPIAPSLSEHVLPALRSRLTAPLSLYHGTSSVRWNAARKSGVLRRAPFGDTCVSMTDDYRVARYFADMACSSEEGGKPVILRVDATGLDARPFSSQVWEGLDCDWERETACWEDVPIDRVAVVPAAKAHRYDKDVYRIQREGDEVLAFAMRLSNDRWSLTDTNDRRIGKGTYGSPKEVAAAFDALRPEKSV